MTQGLRLPAAILCVVLGSAARAEDTLERRAREAAGIIAEKPAWPEALFHESFTRQVSDAQLTTIGAQFFGKCGAVQAVQQISSKGPNFGTFDLITAKGFVVPMTIGLESAAPNAVSTLLFGAPARRCSGAWTTRSPSWESSMAMSRSACGDWARRNLRP